MVSLITYISNQQHMWKTFLTSVLRKGKYACALDYYVSQGTRFQMDALDVLSVTGVICCGYLYF